MKKSDIALIVGVIVVILISVCLMGGAKAESYDLPLELVGEAGLTKLSYDEYQEKIDNGDAFVVIIERAGCSHCINFMPVAEEFANSNNVPMYYIDTDEMDEDDWNAIYTSNSFFKKKKDSWGTPTTIVLLGNKALDYIEGETDADSLLELYSKYFGFENENASE